MPNSRRYSLRSSLFLLVAVCVAPALLMAGILIHQQYRIQLDQIEQSTQLVARKTVADLDRELSAIESALKVLATSSDLKSGDLHSFHARARNALPSGIAYNYILTDRSGRQLLNTLQNYGQALPSTGTPAELQRVFTEAKSVLTNYFIGQSPVAALTRAVTEKREGQLDTLTKDGVPIYTAFATSDNWGWRVAVGRPRRSCRKNSSAPLPWRWVGWRWPFCWVRGLPGCWRGACWRRCAVSTMPHLIWRTAIR